MSPERDASKSASKSSSESVATPQRPTSPSARGSSESTAHQRRHVERDRQPALAALEQEPVARVRLGGRAEAGELTHRPQPSPVHRGIHAARERIRAGRPEPARRVEPLEILGRRDRRQRLGPTRRPARSRSSAIGLAPPTAHRSLGPSEAGRSVRVDPSLGEIVTRASSSAVEQVADPPPEALDRQALDLAEERAPGASGEHAGGLQVTHGGPRWPPTARRSPAPVDGRGLRRPGASKRARRPGGASARGRGRRPRRPRDRPCSRRRRPRSPRSRPSRPARRRPSPGAATTRVVSVAAATSTSAWPTPTVSTITTIVARRRPGSERPRARRAPSRRGARGSPSSG